jgi:hypothetical protein
VEVGDVGGHLVLVEVEPGLRPDPTARVHEHAAEAGDGSRAQVGAPEASDGGLLDLARTQDVLEPRRKGV